MPPQKMTNAEKQRKYRQRINENPEKREAYIAKTKKKYREDLVLKKRKGVKDMTKRELRGQRKEWRRNQKAHRSRNHSNDEANGKSQKGGELTLKKNAIPTKCQRKRLGQLDHSYSSTVPYSDKANQVTSTCSPFYCYISHKESRPVDTVRVKSESLQPTNDETEETVGNIHFPEEWLSCELRTEIKEESSSTCLPVDTVRVKSEPLEPTNDETEETVGNINFQQNWLSYELRTKIKEELASPTRKDYLF